MTVKAMTAEQLTKKIVGKEPLFLLDVRNQADVQDWKIEGEAIVDMNVPYFDLLDGVEGLLQHIPRDREVLVVCAKEGSSILVAEMLSEAGVPVRYLQGGMKAWSEHIEPVKIGNLSGGGELYQFVRMGKGCLSYMIMSNGEAAVVDAARMTEVYIDFAKKHDVSVTHVLDTHLHADHISGGKKLAEQTGAIYWLPPKDAEEVTFEYECLEEGQRMTVGSASIDIQPIYSPGHTIGSTSFIVDNQFLLSGDILFIDSIGRPDLAGMAEDWVDDLRETLYERYMALSKEYIVLPAHFMTIEEMNEDGSVWKELGLLLKENHGLHIEDQNVFRKMVTEGLPAQPHAFQEIRKANMGKLNPGVEEQREMEIGPNRCAIR
ncbi:MBL fold metallo-hydrolase [Bacillus safensis]|uniref:MBL fold metallo-hydrolase n=1 Tax=Bacillus safensis TaxID=561879 RepID=UPI002041FCF3|nr:MBL fold metallo-hydrolase [Bacillus safensis]MCM2990197.1 MBL fold metallo-hydrolase [Bacillus safensis]